MPDEATGVAAMAERLRLAALVPDKDVLRARKELRCEKCGAYIVEKSGCRACKGDADVR